MFTFVLLNQSFETLKKFIFFVCIPVFLGSCTTLKTTRLFHPGKDYQFNTFATKTAEDYKISPDDVMNVRVLANDGASLINITGNTGENQTMASGQTGLNITVESDGTAKFPVVGRLMMIGLTKREAENFLENKYAEEFKNPFVTIEISNRSVLVFPGSGAAKVVNFTKENMTLVDALAEAGGAGKGKTKKIELIRGNLKNPEVYEINLNTLEGMKSANLALQNGDIIYVQPYESGGAQFTQEVLPYLTTAVTLTGLVTTVILLVTQLSK